MFGTLLLLCSLAWPALLPAQQAARDNPVREQPVREQTALKFIPDDAAFYSSSMRLKQQFTTVISSKAFARLSDLPFVKSAVEEIKNAWSADTPPAKTDAKHGAKPDKDAKEGDEDEDEDDSAAASDLDWSDIVVGLKTFWSDSENQQLVGVGLDALSHEIFIYGDTSIIGFLKYLQTVNGSLQALSTAAFAGDIADLSDFSLDNEGVKLALDLVEKLPVPAIVVGFKLSDPAPAKAQVARLEKVLRAALEDVPAVAKGLRREKMGSDEYLTLKLDGSQIPWDELIDGDDDDTPDPDKKPGDNKCDDDDADNAKKDDSDDESAENRAVLKELAKRLKFRSLTLSIGFHENYLLFSFGETNAHLLRFSGKGKRLVDRPELAPLLKSGDKPLTGISYVSQELAAFSQESAVDVDQLKALVGQWGETI
ncbi:MAG TPA: hypothetical protein VGH74_12835, partial [Planctomycetaceae bacterium]